VDNLLDTLIRVMNPLPFALNGVVPMLTLLTSARDNPWKAGLRTRFPCFLRAAPTHARVLLLRMKHQKTRTAAYFARRCAEGLSDRNAARCMKRIHRSGDPGACTAPIPDAPTGMLLRRRRRKLGTLITVLSPTPGSLSIEGGGSKSESALTLNSRGKHARHLVKPRLRSPLDDKWGAFNRGGVTLLTS
jgi:transposase